MAGRMPSGFSREESADYINAQQRRCRWCKDESPAVCYCPGDGCGVFLCGSCMDHHGRLKAYDGHTVRSMEELQDPSHILLSQQKRWCKQHSNRPLTEFCNEESCHHAICLACSTTSHRGHQIVNLDQKSFEMKEELQNLAQAARGQKVKAEDISGRIGTEINETNIRFEEVSSAVRKVFEKLQSQLKSRQEVVIADLKKFCIDKRNQLKHQTDRAELLASKFDSVLDEAERACAMGNPVDFLKTSKQIISRMCKLNALDVDKHLPFLPAGEAFLSFTDDHNRVLSEIESLIPGLGQCVTSADERQLIPQVKIEFPWGHGSPPAVKTVQKVRVFEASSSIASVETLGKRLFVYLQPPDGSTMECKGGRQCDDFYEFEFQPQVAGLHQLSISVSGLQVDGSPFLFDVVDTPVKAADVDPVPSIDVTWTEAFAKCEHSVVLKLGGQHSLPPRPGQITAQCTMPDLPAGEGTPFRSNPWRSLAQITETEETGTFRVTYTPPSAGQLLMAIEVNGKAATTPPVVITVSPLHPDSTEMAKLCSSGRSYMDGAALYMPCAVLIRTRDYKGNRLTTGGYAVTATVKPSSLSVPDKGLACDVQDKSDGSYIVIFTPRTPEPHLFTIKVCGYEVRPNTPFVVPVQDSLTFKEPLGGYRAPSAIAIDKESRVVYVADGKKSCIHRLSMGNVPVVSASPINLSLCHTFLIALSTARKLVVLVPGPQSSTVFVCSREGKEELKWSCALENTKPTSITISAMDHVIIGDSNAQALFLYGMVGDHLGRIQLPEGALVQFHNVCTDPCSNDILVATFSEPYRIMRYAYQLKAGSLSVVSDSTLKSPAQGKQLALAATPEGVLLLATPGEVLVLQRSPAPESVSIARRYKTDHLYMELACAGDGCFVALDRNEKHVTKYKYQP